MAPTDPPPGPSADEETAAAALLRALTDSGVEHVWANLGTDHTPLLEAAARLRETDPTAVPRFVNCAHEYVAMTAAHGYAVATGEPQVVLVHVDVGTQHLGGALHNAHRANAPILVLAGLAPSTDAGHPGSRSHVVHYYQDVFDQPGIVREYCRWTGEYRPPGSPAELVSRGLERALAPPAGPAYLAATREALETPVASVPTPPVRRVRPTGADDATLDELAGLVDDAEHVAVLTSAPLGGPGDHDVSPLVRFAEAAGAGVVEHAPVARCFPRDHDLHAGFDPAVAFEAADLLLLASTDVPWIPSRSAPPSEATVVQVDAEPTKATYPRWPFPVDVTVAADPAETLRTLADRVSGDAREARVAAWTRRSRERRERHAEAVARHREAGTLTPAVVASAVAARVDDSTVVVDDGVTSHGALLEHLRPSAPGSYHWKGGSSIGWSVGAALGVKAARPDRRVVAFVGDGSYLLAAPSAAAVLADAEDLPVLTVVLDNGGWHAVESAVRDQHPDGRSVAAGVPERAYGDPVDLSRAATVVDAHAARVSTPGALEPALDAAVEAVDGGTYAVLHVDVTMPT